MCNFYFLKGKREGELKLYPGSLSGGNSPSVWKQTVMSLYHQSLTPEAAFYTVGSGVMVQKET